MKIESPVLRRLGPVPFWRGETRCLDSLEAMYARAVAAAESALGGGAPDGRGGTDSAGATTRLQGRAKAVC